jgi:hypothetical protein
MIQLSATRCSCDAILWDSLVSFAAITLCVASQQVFIVVVYFVIDSVRKLLDTPSYNSGLKTSLARFPFCTQLRFYKYGELKSLSMAKRNGWKVARICSSENIWRCRDTRDLVLLHQPFHFMLKHDLNKTANLLNIQCIKAKYEAAPTIYVHIWHTIFLTLLGQGKRQI